MNRILVLWVIVAVAAGCSNLPATPMLGASASPPTGIIAAAASPALADTPTSTSATPASATSPSLPQDAAAFPDPNQFKWVPVVSGLTLPVDIQFPDDGSGRMFLLEQPGIILVAKDGKLAGSPFLDISSEVGSTGNEQGLLGLAFHPDFKHQPYFYVNYTDLQGNTVIARFQSGGDTADPSSEKDLLHVAQPFPNHNGGVLTFGPDGYLYAGLGDGGSAGDPYGNGQNTAVLLGKILRIDVDHGDPYAIPAGNPFANEIWEYGLRNPWRISFDRATGDLFIADVGQDLWEEVDYVAKDQGALDFGWNYREGSHKYSAAEPPAALHLTYPVAEYSHAEGGCSVTGGYVYRGALPEWQGIYLYGDYCSGYIWGLVRSKDPNSRTGWDSQLLFQTGANITTFGQDPSGEVYFADRGGTIYKLEH